MKTDGLTTTQVHTALKALYDKEFAGLESAADSIEQTRGRIDTRYSELDSGKVTPPSKEELDREYARFYKVFAQLTGKKEEAQTLENDLDDGRRYLDRPALDAETLESIKRRNPTMYEQAKTDEATCIEHFKAIQTMWGRVSNLRGRMEARLRTLSSSLAYFQAITANGGKSLSYPARSAAAFSAPKAPLIAVDDPVAPSEKPAPVPSGEGQSGKPQTPSAPIPPVPALPTGEGQSGKPQTPSAPIPPVPVLPTGEVQSGKSQPEAIPPAGVAVTPLLEKPPERRGTSDHAAPGVIAPPTLPASDKPSAPSASGDTPAPQVPAPSRPAHHARSLSAGAENRDEGAGIEPLVKNPASQTPGAGKPSEDVNADLTAAIKIDLAAALRGDHFVSGKPASPRAAPAAASQQEMSQIVKSPTMMMGPLASPVSAAPINASLRVDEALVGAGGADTQKKNV